MRKIVLLLLTLTFSKLAFAIEKASLEQASEQRTINVQVDIKDAFISQIPKEELASWKLYVYAAVPNSRLPLANFTGNLAQIPSTVQLDESMFILPHLTLKQADVVTVIAKASKSENPHEKSANNFIGYSQAINFNQGNHLSTKVTLDQRDKAQ